jgi:hypothetical protein
MSENLIWKTGLLIFQQKLLMLLKHYPLRGKRAKRNKGLHETDKKERDDKAGAETGICCPGE